MAMNGDSFSKVAGGIQSLVTAAGIVIAGIWALYTFADLGSAEKARLDIAYTQQQLSNQQQQPVLSVAFKWSKAAAPINARYAVTVGVFLKNDGQMALDFKDTRLMM